jgi:acyl-CoA thioesterase-1
VFTAVARSRKLPLVPFLLDGFADDRTLFLDDGIHPNAAAQPLILDTVWKELKPLLVRR